MSKKSYIILSGYGIIHAIIDMSCVAVMFSTIIIHEYNTHDSFILIITYNIIAFGLQAPIGLLVDKFQVPRESAFIGCLLVIASIFVFEIPPLVVILAGFGNAFFHVGGGSISLNFSPQKAAAPGIFVAPGAIGLTAGILIGENDLFTALPFILLLIASGIFIVISKIPKINYQKISVKSNIKIFEIVLILLLFSVSIRSLYGLTAEWKSDITLLLILTLATACGKAFGGFLADRFGWARVAISALILSAPLLAFFPDIPLLAISGIFLLQMTMPITLTALSNMLPGRSASAFGLSVFALIVGVIPTYLGAKPFLDNKWIILTIIFLSAGFLSISFCFLYNYFKSNLNIKL
jgi:FSR family fosmidomycin resistance protein-like MFS transporter